MTTPATANEVVTNLTELTRELRELTGVYRKAEIDAARKRRAADRAESVAFVNADGSMDIRKHLARNAAADLEDEALVAEAVVRAVRQEIRQIETRIEVGRTYGAVMRAELQTLGAMP